jgi:hypothetical protein
VEYPERMERMERINQGVHELNDLGGFDLTVLC